MSVPMTVRQLVTKLGRIVGDKWYTFGVRLGVPTNILNMIQASHSAEGVDRWITDMFEYYVNNCNPSWTNVFNTLEEVGFKMQANKLREEYFRGAHKRLKPFVAVSEGTVINSTIIEPSLITIH